MELNNYKLTQADGQPIDSEIINWIKTPVNERFAYNNETYEHITEILANCDLPSGDIMILEPYKPDVPSESLYALDQYDREIVIGGPDMCLYKHLVSLKFKKKI